MYQLVAAAVLAVWIAENQPRITHSLATTIRSIRVNFQGFRSFCYHSIYIPYRSEISLLIGWIIRVPPFECDCCCLRLGGQDHDVQYAETCHCNNNDNDDARQKYCYTCIRTFLETQITSEQAHGAVCMASRTCEIDDRLLRKRLSPSVVRILDRNQILQAANSSNNNNNNNNNDHGTHNHHHHHRHRSSLFPHEKMWHCPTPDCDYIGFISNRTSRAPPTFSWKRIFLSFGKRKCHDERSVRCPACQVSSCQFCAQVWTRGTADHTNLTCDSYATKLANLRAHDTVAFERWIRNNQTNRNVQVCRSPNCNYVIEKNHGCNHMTCRCGHEFCWICGETWSNQHSYFCRRRPPADAADNNNNTRRDAADGWTTWFLSWFR